MTTEERIQTFSNMWTIDIDRYALIEIDPERPSVCAIKDLQTGGLVVIDDDDDVLEAVIAQMRRVGVPVMTMQQARPK